MKKSVDIDLNDYKNFKIILEKDKKDAENNVLINNNRLIHDNANVDSVLSVSKTLDEKYGLNLKLINISNFINITNDNIVESNRLFEVINSNDFTLNYLNSYNFSKHLKLNEYMVYDIRKYIDDLLSIVWILKQNGLVEDLLVMSIGDYLNKKDKEYDDFDEFIDFFNTINDLSNSYKHSYSNSLNPFTIGRDKNCVVNYYAKYGKGIYHPKICFIELDDLITQFNKFLEKFEELIRKYNEECS